MATLAAAASMADDVNRLQEDTVVVVHRNSGYGGYNNFRSSNTVNCDLPANRDSAGCKAAGTILTVIIVVICVCICCCIAGCVMCARRTAQDIDDGFQNGNTVIVENGGGGGYGGGETVVVVENNGGGNGYGGNGGY